MYYRQISPKCKQNFTPVPDRNLFSWFSFFLSVCSIPGCITNPSSCVNPLHAAVTSDFFFVTFLFTLYTLFLVNQKIFISSLDFSPELQTHIFICLLTILAWLPQRHLKSTGPKINQLSLFPSFKPSSLPMYSYCMAPLFPKTPRSETWESS